MSVVATGAVALVAGAAPAAAGAADASTSFRCPLSRPTAQAPPYFDYGTRRLAMSLPPRATLVAVPEGRPGGAFVQADGLIRTKIGWRAPRGAPRITGRRLDRPAPPLRAHVGPLSFAVPGGEFYPSSLYFPSTGCWRIAATSGRARLVAVLRVVEA